MIEPFAVRVPQADLDDLRERVRRTRFPGAETDAGQGVPLETMRALCGYWADGYDWRAAEGRLNAFPQFRRDGIHFIHARSASEDAVPLILTHGWPGSVLEFLKVIGPLTRDFHVVVPSLPGYGFSDARAGWGVERIADAWVELMHALGYRAFGAAGSDWGTTISTLIGSRAAGIHLFPPLAPPVRDLEPTEREAAALADLEYAAEWGSGYSRMHATRPQTVGYALLDSPAGLLAWIGEKLLDWSDVRPTDDEILDTVTLYWLTGTGASSARLYWESIRQVDQWISGEVTETVGVPTGCSVFPRELQRPSRRWAERRFTNIRHWNDDLERGGHFAALEVPELFVDELRASFLQ